MQRAMLSWAYQVTAWYPEGKRHWSVKSQMSRTAEVIKEKGHLLPQRTESHISGQGQVEWVSLSDY